jgi:protein-tyrosine phosphatase
MRVLFVCMGNICRSPTAEGVFRRLIDEHTRQRALLPPFEIDSAGTHDYHIGEAPDRRAIAAAARRGVDLSELRARRVDDNDFGRFDLILAMDRENLSLLHQRAPRECHPRIRLILDYAPEAYTREVPDPYYGGAKGFEEVLDLLEQAAQGLLTEVLRESRQSA